ncbi:hypothetical protein [Humisphaera borealis]|uniref:DUF1819 family protein n=1 Tax=Humisphaera borealis TaxID=2807512 RepID=A0A7M2WXX3_9BACT|nr:hypothetical protein [Humisphaera borealis]QOV89370.1 hypothetical protein IPV69_24735 [Humisphaera borealis]
MLFDPVNTGFLLTPEQQAVAADEKVGFHFGGKGTHTSRTIMLDELASLLRAAGPDFTRADYRRLIVEDNCLGKRTGATRRITDQRLSELYALDGGVVLFRVLRQLWAGDDRGRPLLALLMTLARDPLLRFTSPAVLRLQPGEELGRQSFTDALNRGTGSRFNEAVLDKIVRNAASSWTQSGHLEGRSRKTRRAVSPTPAVVTFALVLGYALGARGAVLFETLWSKVLDASTDELLFLAMDAKRVGYLDLKVSGGVVEVSFSRLLTEEERRLIHGTD